MSLLTQAGRLGLVLLTLVAYFLAAVVYFVIGCVFSAPYTFLAGWNFDNFYLGAWLMPPILTFLFVFWKIKRDLHRKNGRAFWIIVAYLCFPIILNGVSILLKLAGYGDVGHYIFMKRYFSLWAIPVLLIVCASILEGRATLRQRFGRNMEQPRNARH